MTQSPGEEIGKSKRKIPYFVRVLAVMVPIILLLEVLSLWMSKTTSSDPSQLNNDERLQTIALLLGGLFLMLALIGGGIAAMIYMSRREYRKMARVEAGSSDMLDQFMPGLALPTWPPQPRRVAPPAGSDGGIWPIVMTGGTAGAIVLIITVPLYWIILHSIDLIGPMILVLLMLARHWDTLKEYARDYEMARAPLFGERYWDIVGSLVLSGFELGIVLLAFLLLYEIVTPLVKNSLLSLILSMVILQMVLVQAVKWRIRLYVYWIFSALHQLNYKQATARVRRLPGLLTPLRVYVLTIQGKLEEAEALLYDLIREARLKPDKLKRHEVLYLEQLACLRFAQGNYNIVNPIFQHIRTELAPKDADGMVLCAAAYLHLGIERARAQAFADAAVNIMRKKHWLIRIGDYFTLGEALAIQSWALAQNDQPDQARQIMKTALAESKEYRPLPRASVLLTAGHACTALGEMDAARRCFEQAAALVPEGSVGQQAQRALQSTRIIQPIMAASVQRERNEHPAF